MLARNVLRLLAVVLGFGLGFGTAFVVSGAAFEDRSKPRCPRCKRRHDVHPIIYTPVKPPVTSKGELEARAAGRYIGIWTPPNAPGPKWSCNTCWHQWGDRFEPPRRR